MTTQDATSAKPNSEAIVASTSDTIVSGPAEEEANGILTIDLSAIVHNWRFLASRVAPAECSAVVKANAYGCDIDKVAPALVAAGCKTFFVAHLAEARQLRSIAPEAIIYVLNGLTPGSASAFAAIDARPALGSLTEIAEWDAFRKISGWRGGAALHFDTGMNRLGLAPDDASSLAIQTKMPDHGITLIMSHFACADHPKHPLNSKQLETFRQIKALFPGITSSLANSSGIFLGSGTYCDLVRPGYALYGGNPSPGNDNPMQPVIELKGRIIQIRHVARGETVGYAATWSAKRSSRIAIVSAGYADGYMFAGSSPDEVTGTEAFITGERCRVAGRISMDLLALDITDLPEKAVRVGDWATLIGDSIDIDELAAMSGTIGYEILCNLGRRYRRIWKS